MNRISGNCKLSAQIVKRQYMYDQQKTCENNLHVEKSYSPEISRLRSECISLTDNDLIFKNKQNRKFETSKVVITKKSFTTKKSLIESYCNQIKEDDYLNNKKICDQFISFAEFKLNDSNLRNNSNLIQLEFDLVAKSEKQPIQDNQNSFSVNVFNSQTASSSKKCFIFRSTPYYKECLIQNYKCVKYRNDPVKLNNCRDAFKINNR